MAEVKSDILQGTLDLMVLKTLDAMGSLHGIRYREANRAGQRRGPADQPRYYLSLSYSSRTEGMDFGILGGFREQPQGKILLAHSVRA